jgi:hypothetical protein
LRDHARPLPKDGARPARHPAGASMVQMWKPLVNVPWMKGQWDTRMVNNRVVTMKSRRLELVAGAKIGKGVNPAVGLPVSWPELQAWNLVHPNPPRYVRMHMLNARLGGAGNTKANLAPGSHDLNQQHYRGVEKPLVRALEAGGQVHEYRIAARYQIGGGGLKWAKSKKAYQDTLDRLLCEATFEPKFGAAKQKLLRVLHEKSGLTKKANWKGR